MEFCLSKIPIIGKFYKVTLLTCIINIIPFNNFLYSQDLNKHLEKNSDSFRNVTIKIMKELDIPIRYFTHRDEELIYSTYKSNFITARYSDSSISVFNAPNGKPIYEQRWCHKPKIEISSTLDSILSAKKVVSFTIYVNAKSTIIHELTHFLQQAYVIKSEYISGTRENWHAHINQQPELEAYAVEAYYFLSMIDPIILKKVLETSSNKREKFIELINSSTRILYPNNKDLLIH